MLLDYAKNHKMDSSSESKEVEKIMVDELLFKILKYLNRTENISRSRGLRKRDIALKRSINHIKDNKNRLLSVKELCKVAQVSERTLEYAFKDKLELGPKEFLSCFRLNCYREKIINNPTATLSDIAYDLEYKHLGNLAKNYRKLFGNLPSSSGAE